MSDVGDVDADQIVVILFLNSERIIEVKGGGAVNGDGGKMGEIGSAGIIEQFLLAALQMSSACCLAASEKLTGSSWRRRGIFSLADQMPDLTSR